MDKLIGIESVSSEDTGKKELLEVLEVSNKDVLECKVGPIEDTFKKLRIVLNDKEKEVIIVPLAEKDKYLTAADKEMDRRFDEAVAAAIADLKEKGLPVARYDNELKKVYFEMPDGTKTYID